MTWPNVTINQLNQRQGKINEVERTVLFVGNAATGDGDLVALNSQSDIDTALTDASEALREVVRAAKVNAGQNWQAYALLVAAGNSAATWPSAIESMQDLISVEGVVAVTQLADASEGRTTIEAFSALRETLVSKLGRWVWFVLTASGPLTVPGSGAKPGVTWADYLKFQSALAKDIAAHAVQLVPSLWGNEAGVLAGRLCNRSVTIADSPARVKTGAIVGLGIESSDLPVDSAGIELDLAQLRAMHDLRYSVPMWYPDYEGIYWADGLTLDVKGGDYPVIEYLRIVDKAARRVRIQAIAKIGDRSLNSTPASIASHKTYFSKTLREMSRSTQINGVTFPGEVKPPQEGDVEITWTDTETVQIYLVVRPYESPKSITVSIMLDSSLEA
ncbi:DUF2586 domain-containing protein [Klebsiella sp. CVUAS 5466.2]|uniref:DUF2586 domain-containing protein n=1 Tax=Klebsiella sp. CVUAS 5466.2 TaxID=2058159 RepID=UPI001C806BEA|nr:DUF2586 domain-containing protein [Klebsiella sp. CVUAS 5466.2]MBX4673077.1 DUF2586 domain-containing protein [Klebsiella sp. CVUAS 5466.2]